MPPLGRTRDGAGDFRGWYGFVTFEDSVRDPGSGLWTSKGTRLRMAGPAEVQGIGAGTYGARAGQGPDAIPARQKAERGREG